MGRRSKLKPHKVNSYCPHCGSNCIGSPTSAGSKVELCDECKKTYHVDSRILFNVNTAIHRPDPMQCCAFCVHADTPLPWADGACIDLPFWLMPLVAADSTEADTKYVNEVFCTAFLDKRQEKEDD